MEMQFTNITSIRAKFPSRGPETLEIELRKPPIFFGEVNQQPKKHTICHATSDFTNGQRKRSKIHYIQFTKRTLMRHYKPLLGCDERVLHLSRMNFSMNSSPYFDFYFGEDHKSSDIQSSLYQQQQQQQAMVASFHQAYFVVNPMARSVMHKTHKNRSSHSMPWSP